MRRSFINRSKHSSNQPSSNRFITEFLEARRLLAAVSWDGGGDGTTGGGYDARNITDSFLRRQGWVAKDGKHFCENYVEAVK